MTKNTKNNGPKARAKPTKRVVAPIASSSIVGPSTFTMHSLSEGVVRFRGHEILGQVTADVGNVAAVYDLNPACWTNSRLARIASTYEKYRYDKFTVRYHPYVATTATGVIATYVELETDEDAAADVTVAMNHQYSAMGPVWAGQELTYVRPTQDPKAYILTDSGAGNRNDMSQGKIYSISFAPAALYGFLTIEYDVVFMYPELESGYGGQQFEKSLANIPITPANGTIVANPTWASAGVKIAEVVINNFDLKAGSTLYTGWDGAAWCLYENLEQALAIVNPLRSAAGLAGGAALNYWVRRLTRV